MTQKLKTITLAFSALIVNSMFRTILALFVDDFNYVRLISGIAVIILGGLYMKVVMEPFGSKRETNQLFIIIAFVSITVFSFVSLFTTRTITSALSGGAVLQDAGSQGESALFSICISIFLTPVVEEIIYRGFLYRQLATIDRFAAIIISSFVFAISHGTIQHLYTCIVGGLIFARVYDKTHKLRYPIALHALFNTLTVVLSLIDFPDMVTQSWFIFAVNMIQLMFVTMLFLIKPSSAAEQASPVLTDAEIKHRAETKRIVNEVMNEYKSKRR